MIATTGAQEALWLVLTALFEPGDVLLVPDPTYVGATGAAAVARVPVAPVWPLTPERVAATVGALAAEGRRARALYLVPDFANPEGDTLDEATRRALVALARRTGLLLLEDSPYRAFAFEAPPPPSLLALDGEGHVVQLGSFAKTLPPGWALDAAGRDCAEPGAVPPAMACTLGGYKGAGLGLAIELLCAGLAGSSFGSEMSHLYAPPWDTPRDVAHLILAIRPPSSAFRARVSAYLAWYRAQPREDGQPTLVPGDLERDAAARSERVPVEPAVAEALGLTAD